MIATQSTEEEFEIRFVKLSYHLIKFESFSLNKGKRFPAFSQMI